MLDTTVEACYLTSGLPMSDYYKRELPQLDLSVERDTENVPNDGCFYLLRRGKIIADFPTEKSALKKYREILEEVGFQPQEVETKKLTPSERWLEDYFYAKEMYWAESHKYTEKGGPGRH